MKSLILTILFLGLNLKFKMTHEPQLLNYYKIRKKLIIKILNNCSMSLLIIKTLNNYSMSFYILTFNIQVNSIFGLIYLCVNSTLKIKKYVINNSYKI